MKLKITKMEVFEFLLPKTMMLKITKWKHFTTKSNELVKLKIT